MRRKRIIIAAATIAAVTIPASTALAQSEDGTAATVAGKGWGPPSGAPCSVGSGVTVCYEAYGDKFWVKDKIADGMHVDGVWSLDGSTDNYCHNRHGKDAGWTYCDFHEEVPEHDWIVFRGFVMDSDENPQTDGTAGPEIQAKTT